MSAGPSKILYDYKRRVWPEPLPSRRPPQMSAVKPQESTRKSELQAKSTSRQARVHLLMAEQA